MFCALTCVASLFQVASQLRAKTAWRRAFKRVHESIDFDEDFGVREDRGGDDQKTTHVSEKVRFVGGFAAVSRKRASQVFHSAG